MTTTRASRRKVGPRPAPTLRILETRVYRGPSYWSYDPAVKLLVDLGVLEEFPSNTIPGFVEGLLDLMPAVGRHSCSTGKAGGFEKRLRDGTWVGHVAEHIALQLQREAGTEVGRGKTRSAGEPGRYHVVYAYAEESVGLAAGRLAVRLVNHLVEADPTFDFAADLEKLILLAEKAAFGPSTQALLDEAAMRDIPAIRLNEQSLVQLGHGVHQKRIRATMTSLTSSLGVDIASDKKLTNRLLAATGVPVPRSEVVRNEEEAVKAAMLIGHPVAIKPLDGNHGRGVMLNLSDDTAVRGGFAVAHGQSRHGAVVVESYLTGSDYRLAIDSAEQALAVEAALQALADADARAAQVVELTWFAGLGQEQIADTLGVARSTVVRDWR